MVFQNYALYPHMTVEQNLAFGLQFRKLPKSEVKERVGRAAELLEIDEYLDKKPRALSGGQRQRVAMGRAHRARAAGVSHGRAPVEPRREAARADAGRDPRPPAPPPRDDRSTSPTTRWRR